MKKITILLLVCACFMQCAAPKEQSTSSSNSIIVGVFDGHGGAQGCIWETAAAVSLDLEMKVRIINSADIANNVLDSIDAIIIPGGSGKSQYLNLGAQNQQKIKDFVAKGKGAVGICAGAYFFSNTPDYACISLNGEQAIDIEHDNRGHGMAKFSLTEQGKELFPELAHRDTNYVMYYEGPVFITNPSDTIKNTTFAIMESDVHEEGNAPANMTNAKPFFLANNYGLGRVFSCISHPEATAGMMWMIPRMVRWTLNKPIIAYSSNVMQPDLFNKELLMSVDRLKQEANYFKVFLYGDSAQKIEALNWLESHHSWSAKRWIQGLLYDGSPDVRVRAAQYVANTHYLPYLPNLRAAYNSEADQNVKAKLKEQLDRLEALLPKK